jgi:hypothetical protein
MALFLVTLALTVAGFIVHVLEPFVNLSSWNMFELFSIMAKTRVAGSTWIGKHIVYFFYKARRKMVSFTTTVIEDIDRVEPIHRPSFVTGLEGVILGGLDVLCANALKHLGVEVFVTNTCKWVRNKNTLPEIVCCGSSGSMGVNPSTLSIPLCTREGASWLLADAITLESLGELWNDCNGDKRSSLE